MTGQQSTLRCEKCHRQVGQSIVDCPNRTSGSCPFHLWRSSPDWKVGIFLLAVAVVWNAILFFLVREVVTQETWLGRVGLGVFAIPFVLVGLFLPCCGIYLLMWRGVTLHSPAQGIVWQRENVLGVNHWLTVVDGQEVLALAVGPPQKLSFPASVAELVTQTAGASGKLNEQDLAPTLAAAALLGLLSQRMLELHRARIETTGMRLDRGDGYSELPASRHDLSRHILHVALRTGNLGVAYIMAPSDAESHTAVDGSLEGRMLDSVRNWPRSSLAKDWPLPPTIYLLVRAVFEENRWDPDRWLVDLVREDAVTRGLFTKQQQGWLRKPPYKLVSLPVDHLIEENEITGTWRRVVARQYPEFASALEKEIRRAIRSRETSGD